MPAPSILWLALIFHFAVGSLPATKLLKRVTHCFSVLGSPVLLPRGTAMGYQNFSLNIRKRWWNLSAQDMPIHMVFAKGLLHLVSTSGTTFPASLVFVASLGEWTQGSIFDIYYLQFAEPGDQYLGRLMVGLAPNSPIFDVLPPGGTNNEHIQRAMELCCGPIIKKFDATHIVKGFLLLCLASMVYHASVFSRVLLLRTRSIRLALFPF